ncbi:PLDc N-terminal domain-containing protein [Rhodococcus sp. 2H158]
MDFWDIIWFIIVSFAFIAYLMVLFSIIGDLFRNHQQSGWIKAIWIVFLIFLPFLTALIYLIVNGKGMAERSAREYAQVKQAQDSYIREVAGKSPAEHIADAKALLDAGTITETEYQALKAKALS